MEKKKQRKINYILKVLDLAKSEYYFFETRNRFLYKIEKELKNMNNDEIYEFLMQLFSVNRDEKIVKEIIDYLYLTQEVYGLTYEEISKKYDGKNFIQLAIEQNYNGSIIENLLKFCSISLINSRDFNGNAIFHTIVNKKDYNLYELLIFESIEIDEELKNNDGYTYIELAKNLIELDKPFNALRIEQYKKEEEVLKNIICDYYYRHFDKFLNMLTDNTEENKKLIENNLKFYPDNIKFGFISKDKYSTDLLLFRCLKEFEDCFKASPYLKKLIETGIPDVTKKIDKQNFASYAIDRGYSICWIYDLVLLVDKKYRDEIYFDALKKIIRSNPQMFSWGLYSGPCMKGFNLLNCHIDIIDIYEIEYIFSNDEPLNGDDAKDFVIELYNAYQIKLINEALKKLNYDKFIKSCRYFCGKRIYEEEFTSEQIEFLALKIIENREDSIYESDEITKEEVISVIENNKLVFEFDEHYPRKKIEDKKDLVFQKKLKRVTEWYYDKL